jgi:hypothetical protein
MEVKEKNAHTFFSLKAHTYVNLKKKMTTKKIALKSTVEKVA